MAKGRSQNNKPDSFGKKKKNIAKKKYNKHTPKPKDYRGQGR